MGGSGGARLRPPRTLYVYSFWAPILKPEDSFFTTKGFVITTYVSARKFVDPRHCFSLSTKGKLNLKESYTFFLLENFEGGFLTQECPTRTHDGFFWFRGLLVTRRRMGDESKWLTNMETLLGEFGDVSRGPPIATLGPTDS